MPSSLSVQDMDVFIEGQGPTVVMLHGWPDSPALWDETVAALSDGYRCVRFALPGFDLSKPPRPVSVDQMCELVGAVVNAVSPNEPVTMLLHDWGCFFGYEYAARHPQRVSRVVGVDIGDTNSSAYLKGLSGKEKILIAGYQLWLAAAWKLGGVLPGLADRMTRFMARKIGCRTAPERIGWQMNYPYAMQWLGAFGGLRGVARVDKVFGPCMPTLFAFGKRKPFMFHSSRWLAQLADTPGSATQGFEAGHWLMRQKPLEFTTTVRSWLDQSRVKPLEPRAETTA
ncbi:MAG: alpha/beta hydrolase [Betaproteobacteria bacterium HGW-Betaproteobacteria-16]|nr:MAG: alpha/beta hydrolase [Betaproteobacteria bacterium HGW-Betaproteobacteria-16]